VKVTVPVNPPLETAVTVADCPAVTEFDVVEDGAETLRAGCAGSTKSVGHTLNCSFPAAASHHECVISDDCGHLGVTVTVELAPLAVGTRLAGFAVHVPANGSGHVIATAPVKPLVVVAVTVKIAGFPALTVWLPGLTANLKLGWSALSSMVELLLDEPRPPFATAKAGLPSPFKSPVATAMPLVKLPLPVGYCEANLKVPSPFPRSKYTGLASAVSRMPSSLKSPTAIEEPWYCEVAIGA
jgi:hypothetical protein